MRLQDRYFDDFDQFDDFDDSESLFGERSAAFNKLLNEHRREERHRKQQDRDFAQARRLKREDWYWDDEDLDAYVDDCASRYTDTRSSYY